MSFSTVLLVLITSMLLSRMHMPTSSCCSSWRQTYVQLCQSGNPRPVCWHGDPCTGVPQFAVYMLWGAPNLEDSEFGGTWLVVSGLHQTF
eukprot:1158847-Pelagomonas_calceolata.AAC.1